MTVSSAAISSASATLVPDRFLELSASYLRSQQLSDGAIPWFSGGYADPWDHVEAAMGLTICGDFEAARAAYRWLASIQLEDGSWWAAYRDGQVDNRERRESNFVAYIATGLWHYYLVAGDRQFLSECWSMVSAALEFVIGLQTEHGDIHWAVDSDSVPLEDALITGCASVYKSLECGIQIARVLGQPWERWWASRACLGEALREHPERFDRTWESKARFSMDWFYPVLTGVFQGAAARERLDARWQEFVEQGLGCRCVNDEPWVTVAESCELTMALLAAGERAKAEQIFCNLHRWRDADGGYWTGYVFRDEAIWPEEKTTWTLGAVLLAADALLGLTPACELFTTVGLELDAPQDREGIDHLDKLELGGGEG